MQRHGEENRSNAVNTNLMEMFVNSSPTPGVGKTGDIRSLAPWSAEVLSLTLPPIKSHVMGNPSAGQERN